MRKLLLSILCASACTSANAEPPVPLLWKAQGDAGTVYLPGAATALTISQGSSVSLFTQFVVTRLRVNQDFTLTLAYDPTKIYRRYARKKQFATLKSALLKGSLISDLQPDETFPALRGVSCTVPKGCTYWPRRSCSSG